MSPRALPEPPPTYFRLSDESWAEIAEAYRNGASAKALAAKWKVSPSSIYRHACADGFTKKRGGDAVARANVAAVEAAEAKAAEARAAVAAGQLAAAPTPELGALRARALEDLALALARGAVAEADRLGRLLLTLDKLAAGGSGGGASDGDDEGYSGGVWTPKDSSDTSINGGPHWRLPHESKYDYDTRMHGFLEGACEKIEPFILKLAYAMLGDRFIGPAAWSRTAMRWRAQTFGPEVAANDYAEMCKISGGAYVHKVYDENGEVRPGFLDHWRRSPGLDDAF